MSSPAPAVIVVAAAGPRRGFGHLTRCRSIVRVLDVPAHVVLRGSASTARAAVRLGWTVHRDLAQAIRAVAPRLVIVDDPSPAHAARFVRTARALGVPTASIHDLGFERAPADVTIDGSLTCVSGSVPADLQGPEFAILDPLFERLRKRRPPRDVHRVLIALGGGAHVRAVGVRVAARMVELAPYATVDLAAGMLPPSHTPRLPPRCRWIAQATLPESLATATAAVVGGGLTLYEACALGTPAVALPVTSAQALTTRAFAAAGAARDVRARTRHRAAERAARYAVDFLADPALAARVGRRGRRLVDARGARRVAAHLLALSTSEVDLRGRLEARHVA
jgi:spore coat polysaccharide biosynthesis predicted glycosyltransferase SpsG